MMNLFQIEDELERYRRKIEKSMIIPPHLLWEYPCLSEETIQQLVNVYRVQNALIERLVEIINDNERSEI